METHDQTLNLKNKTGIVFGSTRGIGEAIAKELARRGVNVVVTGTDMHPQLGGTTGDVAAAIQKEGGSALAVTCDLRKGAQIRDTFHRTISAFGEIDFVVYVASALLAKSVEKTTEDDLDLIHAVNTRGAFLACQAAVQDLKDSAAKGRNPHILTISPPWPLSAEWLNDLSLTHPNLAYTLTKIDMTGVMLGFANMLEKHGVAANALWPEKVEDTAALRMLARMMPGIIDRSRKPQIMADAAAWILSQPSSYTKHTLTDEHVLRAAGVTDFSSYATVPGTADADMAPDWFLGE